MNEKNERVPHRGSHKCESPKGQPVLILPWGNGEKAGRRRPDACGEQGRQSFRLGWLP
ncbi:unnamed protein product [Nyctereutes procyonoides]|uniref:(raccoon dog) hypothetical protein n=1 Tax=Nyctereutes procyonoides TaxID=34880 RepID=A0A811Z491_NYCPR|nr:unnamed protein product [Nyctereutes procyonoides]